MDAKDFVSLMKVEINTMKKLNHPNIIGLIDFGEKAIVEEDGLVDTMNVPYLVFEIARGGELFDFI